MDINTFLPQLGISAIFVFIAIMLYKDMRTDSLRREEQIRVDSKSREEQIRVDSKEREEKLLEHLDKQSEINERVADTLENMNTRLLTVEKCVMKEGV